LTAFAVTLPLQRTTPLYVPQRDLVVSSADSVTLTVTVVESDDPAAQPIVLTGGIGGPACMLVVWPDRRWRAWDYGWGASWGAQLAGPTTALWTGVGIISDAAAGAFAIVIPAAAMNTWPLRCRWGFLLDCNGGGSAEMIAEGYLHVRPMVSRSIAQVILLTDPTPPLLTDTDQEIFIDGSPS
jgi:hypothetical protein